MIFARYAVYVTPPPGPLAEFGAGWLGWDAARGRECAAPDISGLPAPTHELTAAPRRYGMHATMKPPFRLAPDTSADALHVALQRLCARLAPVGIDRLVLGRLGGFLALTPSGQAGPVSDIAATTVKALDRFRAPPNAADLARWDNARLSTRRRELLALYGYPHVMEAFRFHITLTGRLDRARLAQTEAALHPHLDPLLSGTFAIDALTLCGEDGSGHFHEIARMPLLG